MGTSQEFLPILIMFGAAVAIGLLLLLLNSFVGRRVRTRRKLMPYESGMPLLDDSRKRISIKFFIVAMIFILFDVDTAFFYPWAVVLRDGGEPVFWAMMPFIALLVLGDVERLADIGGP